jgi:hypothetical protein
VATAQTSTPSHWAADSGAQLIAVGLMESRASLLPGELVVLGRAVGVDAVGHAGGLADLDEISVGIA